MGKLSSHFNPCLNACLEVSGCTVFAWQNASICQNLWPSTALWWGQPRAPTLQEHMGWSGTFTACEKRVWPHWRGRQLQPSPLPGPGVFGSIRLWEGRWFGPEHRAQGTEQPASFLPAGNRASLVENGSAFAQQITTVNYLPKIMVMEQRLAVLGAVQTWKCFCRTEKAQGMCCQWHAK